MIQHIVLWTFKEGIDKDEAFTHLQMTFADFKEQVPGMQSLTLYKGYQGYDVCLMSLHESREALEAYQNFPAHIAAKEVVKATRDKRASCDFELEQFQKQ